MRDASCYIDANNVAPWAESSNEYKEANEVITRVELFGKNRETAINISDICRNNSIWHSIPQTAFHKCITVWTIQRFFYVREGNRIRYYNLKIFMSNILFTQKLESNILIFVCNKFSIQYFFMKQKGKLSIHSLFFVPKKNSSLKRKTEVLAEITSK